MENWDQKLTVNSDGRFHCHVYNIYAALRSHPAWCGVFGLDAIGRVVFVSKPPYDRINVGPLAEMDYLRIKLFLSECLGNDPSTGDVRRVVAVIAEDAEQGNRGLYG